jgi:tetratricopeptide (TPR) repeat protein
VKARTRLAVLLALAAASPAAGQPSSRREQVIDVRGSRPAAVNSFEALWSALERAEEKGDLAGAQSAFREIRRLRIERNVRSLETFALARVADGLESLAAGDSEKAATRFAEAGSLDPHLPDPHFGLAQAEMKGGPLGVLPAIKEIVAGTSARQTSARGAVHLRNVLAAVGLLALFATVTVFAVAMVLRHGALLRHDFEEAFGADKRTLAFGVAAALLLLPAITFQGWGWLPLWWLALLFLYMTTLEKVVAAVFVLAAVAVGPVVQDLESRLLAQQNPLFRAALLSLEGEPDTRAVWHLEDAARTHPDDRDLQYLLAVQYKKAGRYEDAAAIYREILRATPTDGIALNNLANVEFAAGEFPAAIARYKQGIDSAPVADVAATYYYNLSLAHLQRFEYQPAQEARSQADRIARGLIRTYDSRWKYDKGDYAVVDLNLGAKQLWAKFAGRREGIGAKNLAGTPDPAPPADRGRSLVNRFTAVPLVFAVAVLALGRWRGAKAFTTRCLKCGTPFCRRCHLGVVAGGLCTQCHHLFVVRDGVSGPARNQKLLEVQKEDARRDRVFRLLSLTIPGSGHLYASRTPLGIVLVLLWSLVLATAAVTLGLLPLTETAQSLTPPLGLAVAAVILVVLYVAANRSKPEYEVLVPTRRPPPARRRAA